MVPSFFTSSLLIFSSHVRLIANFNYKKRGIFKESKKPVQLGNLPKEHTGYMIILRIQVPWTPTPMTGLVIKSCNQHWNASQRWHGLDQRSRVMRHYQGPGLCDHEIMDNFQDPAKRRPQVLGSKCWNSVPSGRRREAPVLNPSLHTPCIQWRMEIQYVWVSLFQELYDLWKSVVSSPS